MHVFVLTGAGVSAESGLGTFRDAGGLWAAFDLREVATPDGYRRDPEKVIAFYDMRRRNALPAQPNAAHVALARLRRAFATRGDRLTLVTQNIDDLHERAGGDALHMHGSLFEARCLACDRVLPWRGDMAGAACPACGSAGRLRPNVVWFGEMPFHMEAIEAALAGADLFVAIGTSGAVYPAAGFAEEARRCGARTVEINLAPSDNAALFEERRYGPATETVPRFVSDLLGG